MPAAGAVIAHEILGSSDVDLIVESRFRCFATSPALSIVLSISDLRRSERCDNYSNELCRNWGPIAPLRQYEHLSSVKLIFYSWLHLRLRKTSACYRKYNIKAFWYMYIYISISKFCIKNKIFFIMMLYCVAQNIEYAIACINLASLPVLLCPTTRWLLTIF